MFALVKGFEFESYIEQDIAGSVSVKHEFSEVLAAVRVAAEHSHKYGLQLGFE